MTRAATAFAGVLLLAACGGADEPDPQASELPAPVLDQQELPLQAADFSALASKDCGDVVKFYVDAVGSGEWERAALVWDDPVIDGARLAAVFAAYDAPQIEATEPSVEGAAGSLYCTVNGTLIDSANSATPPSGGDLLLRRTNDVPGATPEQLRWTLQSSTFVENVERSSRS